MANISNVVVYSYIYLRLKRNNQGDFIHIDKLKEEISRTIVRNGGLPRILIKEIIKDMTNLQLIKRIDFRTYQINKSNCCRRINNLLMV